MGMRISSVSLAGKQVTLTYVEPGLWFGDIDDLWKLGKPVGYKVGLTSTTMQTFCGIDHPIGGVVLASRVHRSGASVKRADYGRLGLEFEIAVRIKSDVPVNGRPLTADALAPHKGIVMSTQRIHGIGMRCSIFRLWRMRRIRFVRMRLRWELRLLMG